MATKAMVSLVEISRRKNLFMIKGLNWLCVIDLYHKRRFKVEKGFILYLTIPVTTFLWK